MSLKKFGQNDIILNTMLAYPQNEFFIYNASVYYNNVPSQAGTADPGGTTAVSQVRMVAPGAISLYEYNIDRPDTGDLGGAPAIGEVTASDGGVTWGALYTGSTYAQAVIDVPEGEPTTLCKRQQSHLSLDFKGQCRKQLEDNKRYPTMPQNINMEASSPASIHYQLLSSESL